MRVDALRLHPDANRAPKDPRIRKLIRTMDLDKLGPFVAWRGDDGILYVIDGQHRKKALEALGLGGIEIDVEIIEGATFEDACDLFLGRNDSLLVRQWDKFDKGEKAGYYDHVQTKRVVEAAGFTLGDQRRDGQVIAVAAALESWRIDKGKSFGDALEIINAAWGGSSDALEGQILRGVTLFCSHYNGAVDRPSLVAKLRKTKPGNLIVMAKTFREMGERGSLALNVARSLVGIHNKGRRSGQLPPI